MSNITNIKVGGVSPTFIRFDTYITPSSSSTAVDVTTDKCWTVYLGSKVIYNVDKTVSNVLNTYGFITNKTINGTSVSIIDTTNVTKKYPKVSKFYIPTITDITSIVNKLKVNMNPNNSAFWIPISDWYANNYLPKALWKTNEVFKNSGGLTSITLKLGDYDIASEDSFSGSDVATVKIDPTNGQIESLKRFFRNATKLTTITNTNTSKFACKAYDLEDAFSNTKINILLGYVIHYVYNGNFKEYGYYCTKMSYAFYNSSFTTIHAIINNILITPCQESQSVFYNSMFYYANDVVIDCVYLRPLKCNNIFNSKSNNRYYFLLYNLNNGDWCFDGVIRNNVCHGDFSLSNYNSINYLVNNLANLNTYTSTAVDSNTSNWKAWTPFGGDAAYDLNSDNPVKFQSAKTIGITGRHTDLYTYDIYLDDYFQDNTTDYTVSDKNKLNITVKGIATGDTLMVGDFPYGETNMEIASDGNYVISHDNNDTIGFILKGNASIKSAVQITINSSYNPKNSIVKSANLYLPAKFKDVKEFDFSQNNNNNNNAESITNDTIIVTKRSKSRFTRKSFYHAVVNGSYKIQITGMVSGDIIKTSGYNGIYEDTDLFRCTSDGIYTLPKSDYSMFLYNPDTTITSPVTIKLLESANVITDTMIKTANNKGWHIYFGGVEKVV